MKPEEWAEIFKAGRNKLPAINQSPAVSLGLALLAMEEKALEIQGRYNAAEAAAEAPEHEVTLIPDYYRIRLRQWEIRASDGAVWERWIATPDDMRPLWRGRQDAYHLRGKIFFRDNDRPGGEWNEWVEVPVPQLDPDKPNPT